VETAANRASLYVAAVEELEAFLLLILDSTGKIP
jgi:hypothetical protein